MLGPRLNNPWSSRNFAIAAFVVLCWFLFTSARSDSAPYRKWKTSQVSKYSRTAQKGVSGAHITQHPFREPIEDFEKPLDFRIVALVFYGRREYVSILDCYLQRNLEKNGGMLDEVIFVMRTDDKDDIHWLDEKLQTTPEYTKWDGARGRGGKYADAWNVVEKGTMYIKIDDDVLFFEDHTIAALVRRKMENPEYLLVSANVVNQPALAWVHFHLNTIRPYFPELEPPANFIANASLRPPTWRASELPLWQGPADYTIHPNYTESENYKIKETFKAPFKGHRWLPLGPKTDIDKTPAAVVKYSWKGAGYYSWVVGAQVHYSFLENLENDELWRYKFDLWDYHHDRISINFICVWGDDIVANRPFTGNDDEKFLTIILTKKLGRHAVLDGTGVAVHYGFHKQVAGRGPSAGSALLDTDLLERYRAYADENVCHL